MEGRSERGDGERGGRARTARGEKDGELIIGAVREYGEDVAVTGEVGGAPTREYAPSEVGSDVRDVGGVIHDIRKEEVHDSGVLRGEVVGRARVVDVMRVSPLATGVREARM